MKLVLYSKPGCHLCEGLMEKLNLVTEISFALEIRDITTNKDWFNAYQYEIPVLCLITDNGEKSLPRFSPRASVKQITKQLQKNVGDF
ncbi:MAG: glutaredoxin family protein [Microcystaceae cyanobacterium]